MTTILLAAVVVVLCIAVFGADPRAFREAEKLRGRIAAPAADIKKHGADAAAHGGEVKEKIAGKTCPHCGKPI